MFTCQLSLGDFYLLAKKFMLRRKAYFNGIRLGGLISMRYYKCPVRSLFTAHFKVIGYVLQYL